MIKIFGVPLVSKAHSDVLGISFGILVSIASILIILISTGNIKITCKSEKDIR